MNAYQQLLIICVYTFVKLIWLWSSQNKIFNWICHEPIMIYFIPFIFEMPNGSGHEYHQCASYLSMKVNLSLKMNREFMRNCFRTYCKRFFVLGSDYHQFVNLILEMCCKKIVNAYWRCKIKPVSANRLLAIFQDTLHLCCR